MMTVRIIAACTALLALGFFSCKPAFDENDFTAYFGGEVTHPNATCVYLYKNDVLVDSLPLDEKNRFFKKYDSLSPGLYTFRHDAEYQYVYFEKNDSLLVSINTRDFDESVVFTGRGERKNNFLIELYLQNERDRDSLITLFDEKLPAFTRHIEQQYARTRGRYNKNKQAIGWSDGFDMYAKAAVDLPHFSKKEMYPVLHKIRTGEDLLAKLPKTYYEFRQKVNFNNKYLACYSPFIKYLTDMLNNIAAVRHHNEQGHQEQIALKANISKMAIADSLIDNLRIKNMILTNIAYNYLIEDQNMHNNELFFDTFQRYSTDQKEKVELKKIAEAIQGLKPGKMLPEIDLVDTNGTPVVANNFKKPTVIFFWSNQFKNHLFEAHKKAIELKKQFPRYSFVAINLDDDHQKWLKALDNYQFDGITSLRAKDFSTIQSKWVLTKIHRTIVLNDDGTIKSGFANIFDSHFQSSL